MVVKLQYIMALTLQFVMAVTLKTCNDSKNTIYKSNNIKIWKRLKTYFVVCLFQEVW